MEENYPIPNPQPPIEEVSKAWILITFSIIIVLALVIGIIYYVGTKQDTSGIDYQEQDSASDLSQETISFTNNSDISSISSNIPEESNNTNISIESNLNESLYLENDSIEEINDTNHSPYEEEVPPCNDSDGGQNIYVKGITNGQEDKCHLPNQYLPSCSGEECYVDEQWCDSVVGYQATAILCPYGCDDGACLEESVDYCNDSDGGKDYNVKGYFNISVDSGGIGFHTSGEDLCAIEIDPSANPNALLEYFCPINLYNFSEAIFEVYNCSSGCSNGACI